MKFNEKISVIVPFHSLEKYLPRCLKSIQNQTYDNFEVIMLANNVKDNSRKIAENFAENDKRFILVDFPYQIKNIAMIRNYALKYANGKYIAWVDGDDYVMPAYLEVQYKSLIENNAQMSICRVKKSKDLSYKFTKIDKKFKIKKIFDSKELANRILNDDHVAGGLCNKLHIAEIAKKIEFDNYCSMYEDLEYNLRYAQLCDKAVFNGKKLHIYYCRQGSLTNNNSHLQILKRVSTLNKIISKNNFDDIDIFARGVNAAVALHLLKKCKKSSYDKKVKIILSHYLKDAYIVQKKLKEVFYKKLLVWFFYQRYKKYLKYKLFEIKK